MLCAACAVYTPDLAGKTTMTGAAGSAQAGQGGAGGEGGGGLGGMGVGGASTAGGGAGGAGVGGAEVDAGPDVGASEDAMIEAADAISERPGDVAAESGCKGSECVLKAALVHRYSFGGTGTAVIDSVGKADGIVVNAQLGGNGKLVLAGGTTDQYVDLPNGIIRSLTNATFEFWVTWSGGAGWQRLFDFGTSTAGEGMQSLAASTFYLTPQGGGPTVMLVAFKRQDQMGANETRALSGQGMPMNTTVHLAVVIDATGGLMTLYRDGSMEGSVTLRDPLSLLVDVNNWLGRSQYAGNDSFGGTLDEFRIYGAALSLGDLKVSLAAGPDPPFLN
jgi:hypothetical protein